MKSLAALVLSSAALFAQASQEVAVQPPPAPKSPMIASSQALYALVKGYVMRSMEKVTDYSWPFQPTQDVRTFTQLFAHIGDGQYEFCGAAEGKQIDKGLEQNLKTKPEIVDAVKEAFAYCDNVFANMTDASALQLVDFMGHKMTRLGIMDFNTMHTMEHYGNIVTYMRLKYLIPPSSEGR